MDKSITYTHKNTHRKKKSLFSSKQKEKSTEFNITMKATDDKRDSEAVGSFCVTLELYLYSG